jgi:hypothetical protein
MTLLGCNSGFVLQIDNKERVTCKRNQQPLCGTEIPSHRKEYVVLEKTKRTVSKQGKISLLKHIMDSSTKISIPLYKKFWVYVLPNMNVAFPLKPQQYE